MEVVRLRVFNYDSSHDVLLHLKPEGALSYSFRARDLVELELSARNN